MIKKLLNVLLIFQDKKDKTYTLRRVNPYNPLGYMVVILTIIVLVVMFGVVGIWREIDIRNPFKYQ